MIPEIEKNIELPKPNYKEKWAFHRLEVGDSFAIPFTDEKEVVRLRTAASAYNQRHRVRLTTRTTHEKQGKMLRVWRVE
jgi:hypothetical protein